MKGLGGVHLAEVTPQVPMGVLLVEVTPQVPMGVLLSVHIIPSKKDSLLCRLSCLQYMYYT